MRTVGSHRYDSREESGPSRSRAESPASLALPLVWAVNLMYAGAALTVVALVLDLVTAGSQRGIIRQEYRAGNPGRQLVGSDLDLAVKVAVVALVVGGTVRLLLWLWMGWKNGQGRAWARIVGTVFGVINLLSVTYLGRETVGPQIITVIDSVVGAAVTVLLWLPSSSRYYRASSRRHVQTHPPKGRCGPGAVS